MTSRLKSSLDSAANGPTIGQIVRVARFLPAPYNGQAFALDDFELRAVDVAISDDVLQCLDALRCAGAGPTFTRLSPRATDPTPMTFP